MGELEMDDVIEIGSPLHKAGVALLEAAAAYWRESHIAGPGGAIVWLDDSDGNTVIFTRGEYRRQLLANVEFQTAEKHFAHVTTNAETEAEFEAKTPDGLLG